MERPHRPTLSARRHLHRALLSLLALGMATAPIADAQADDDTTDPTWRVGANDDPSDRLGPGHVDDPTLPAVAAAPPPRSLREIAEQVVAQDDRSDADRELDARRDPVALLEFARVRPGMHAADLGAGEGYTAELLARAVGPSGRVYGQNTPEAINRFFGITWPTRLRKRVMAHVVRIDSDLDRPLPERVRDLDVVTMVFAYHDTLGGSVDREAMNASILRALKPGGAFVVVDHRAAPGSDSSEWLGLHRIGEDRLQSELEAAGFRLNATAGFLGNPDDPRDAPFFELDGPTDAFVHRYVKPGGPPEEATTLPVAGSGAAR